MRLVDIDGMPEQIPMEIKIRRTDGWDTVNWVIPSAMLKPLFNKIPEVEEPENPTMHWICWKNYCHCSFCEKEIEFNDGDNAKDIVSAFKYCPFCGALNEDQLP